MGQPIDTAHVAIEPDASGFAEQFRAQFAAAMRGVVSAVESAMDRVETSVTAASHDMAASFARAGEVAELSLREVAEESKVRMAQVAGSATAAGAAIESRLGGALAFVKGALVTTGIAAGVGLAAIAGFGLKSAASLEQTSIGLEALVGNAKDAAKFMQELQSFAALTPFEFSGVADASRRILAFGQSVGIAREEVIPTLTTIGDLVSVLGGTQENIDAVVRAFGQIASKGRLLGGEVLQLSEALPGFNVNAAVAAAQGLSVADSLKQQEAGAIDATVAINGILAGMAKFPGAAGAMAKQAETLTGVFSTFKDTISIALTNAFTPVIPQIKNSLKELTPVLGEALNQLAPALGKVLAGILPLLGKLATAFTSILVPLLDALIPAMDAFGGETLTLLGQALGEIVVAIAPLIPLIAQFLVAALQLAIPLIFVLAKALQLLTPVFNAWTASIAAFAKFVQGVPWAAAGQVIVAAFQVAWDKLKEIWAQITGAFSEVKAVIENKIHELHETISTKIEDIVSSFLSLPGRVITGLGNAGKALFRIGVDFVQGLIDGTLSMGSKLWDTITSFVYDHTIGAAAHALGIHSPSTVAAEQIGRWIPPGIAMGVEDNIGTVRDAMNTALPGAAHDALGAPGGGATLAAGGPNIIVNVYFSGALPTDQQARRAGAAAGAGLADELQRRRIGMAVQAAGAPS